MPRWVSSRAEFSQGRVHLGSLFQSFTTLPVKTRLLVFTWNFPSFQLCPLPLLNEPFGLLACGAPNSSSIWAFYGITARRGARVCMYTNSTRAGISKDRDSYEKRILGGSFAMLLLTWFLAPFRRSTLLVDVPGPGRQLGLLPWPPPASSPAPTPLNLPFLFVTAGPGCWRAFPGCLSLSRV